MEGVGGLCLLGMRWERHDTQAEGASRPRHCVLEHSEVRIFELWCLNKSQNILFSCALCFHCQPFVALNAPGIY